MTQVLTKPQAKPAKSFTRQKGIQKAADRVLLYGDGGIGKTTLAAQFPGAVFIDLEGGSGKLDVDRVAGVESWADMRSYLQSGDFSGVNGIIIDTATAAEEMCLKHVLANVPTSKGKYVSSIKEYGWNDGYTYVYEEWRRLLGDLDTHYKSGRSIILISHTRSGKVPNPTGEDYLRYEPRLMLNNQASIMHATIEWADHVLFVGYDIGVSKEGRATGGTTRTLYTTGTATHVAKTRSLPPGAMQLKLNDDTVWKMMRGDTATKEEF